MMRFFCLIDLLDTHQQNVAGQVDDLAEAVRCLDVSADRPHRPAQQQHGQEQRHTAKQASRSRHGFLLSYTLAA